MSPISTARWATWLLPASLAALVAGCTMPQPEGDAQGPARYETCAACHGEDGSGNELFGAPAIAGMPLWYVQRQLEKYRDGHRGNDAEDADGLRMRAMVRTLNHEGDLEAVARYVSAMPATTPETTLSNDDEDDTNDFDLEAGRTAFRACVQCHGGAAEGNEDRNAPPLNRLDDWYIVRQLGLFKAGDRGTTPGDDTGAQMRPMALGLADEQAMRNVAAHITTLRSEN